MELLDLQKEIIERSPSSSYYILHGPEGAIQRTYIDRMAEAFNLDVQREDTVSSAVNRSNLRTLSGRKKLFVVFEDKAFASSESSWSKAFSAFKSNGNTLVLQYTKLDARTKFVKLHSDVLCLFDTLSEEIAIKYVKKELSVTDVVAGRIARACECDYGRICMECDKIKHYWKVESRVSEVSQDECAETLLNEGYIYQPVGDITFKLTDSIMERNSDKTAIYLLEALRKREPELVVLTILYNNFRALLLVQGLNDKHNVASRTGLTPWQIQLANRWVGNYSLKELQRNLRLIQGTEYGIKTGSMETSIVLPYVSTLCISQME